MTASQPGSPQLRAGRQFIKMFNHLHRAGLLVLTTFISSSPGLAMPSTLAPNRRGAGSRRSPSRDDRPPGKGEDVVPRASYRRITPAARLGGVPVVAHWVMSWLSVSHNSYIRSFVSHLFDFTGYWPLFSPIMRPPSYRQRLFVEYDLGESSRSAVNAARRAGYSTPTRQGSTCYEMLRSSKPLARRADPTSPIVADNPAPLA